METDSQDVVPDNDKNEGKDKAIPPVVIRPDLPWDGQTSLEIPVSSDPVGIVHETR